MSVREEEEEEEQSAFQKNEAQGMQMEPLLLFLYYLSPSLVLFNRTAPARP